MLEITACGARLLVELSTAGWWQGLLGQGWDRGAGAGPESVRIGFQGVEGVREVGSPWGERTNTAISSFAPQGGTSLGSGQLCGRAVVGSQGRARQNRWAQPCCDPRILALCPVGAGMTPGLGLCQSPSLGWAE